MRDIKITKGKYDWTLSLADDDEYHELTIESLDEMKRIAKVLLEKISDEEPLAAKVENE